MYVSCISSYTRYTKSYISFPNAILITYISTDIYISYIYNSVVYDL